MKGVFSWLLLVCLIFSLVVSLIWVESRFFWPKEDKQSELQSLRAEVTALRAEVADLKEAKGGQVTAQPALPEVRYLERDLEQIQAWADRDGGYSLFLLDQDLDLVAKGEEPRGSFTDFFVLNLDSALSAGVPVEEVRARLERLIALAEEGKPTSSFVRFMMGEDGPAGVRAYAEAKTGVDLTP